MDRISKFSKIEEKKIKYHTVWKMIHIFDLVVQNVSFKI